MNLPTIDGISAYVLALVTAVGAGIGSVLYMNGQVKEAKEEIKKDYQPQIDRLTDDLKEELKGIRGDLTAHNAMLTGRIDSLIQVIMHGKD